MTRSCDRQNGAELRVSSSSCPSQFFFRCFTASGSRQPKVSLDLVKTFPLQTDSVLIWNRGKIAAPNNSSEFLLATHRVAVQGRVPPRDTLYHSKSKVG